MVLQLRRNSKTLIMVSMKEPTVIKDTILALRSVHVGLEQIRIQITDGEGATVLRQPLERVRMAIIPADTAVTCMPRQVLVQERL